MVTVPGKVMIARVAASLVLAGGLPELVARNLDDYARLIEILVKEGQASAGRRRLLRRRTNEARKSRLFDTSEFRGCSGGLTWCRVQWTADLDRSLKMSWEALVNGEPMHITVHRE